MMNFVRKIRELLALSQRISLVESQINEIDVRIKDAMNQYSKDFEKKIQDMTFAYTRNLDDTKSDYLKRYLETRINCISEQVRLIPERMSQIQSEINDISLRIENND